MFTNRRSARLTNRALYGLAETGKKPFLEIVKGKSNGTYRRGQRTR